MTPRLLSIAAAILLALVVAPLALAATDRPLFLPMVTTGGDIVTPPQATALPQPTAIPTTTPGPVDGVCADPVTGAINVPVCEAETIRLVNVERAKVGCPAAVRDDGLMRGARNWADEMARTTYYGHSPSDWYTRPENGGFPFSAGENIGPPASPEGAVTAWMGSAAHRNRLLFCPYSNPNDPSYNPNTVYYIGVGLNLNGGTVLALGIR